MLDLRTLLETFDVSRAAAVASVFRKNHTWLCPTRVTGLALAGDPRLTQSPNLQYVGRKQRASWAKCAGDRDRRWNPCTQIGHRRRMTSVAALAQSASRLPWAVSADIKHPRNCRFCRWDRRWARATRHTSAAARDVYERGARLGIAR